MLHDVDDDHRYNDCRHRRCNGISGGQGNRDISEINTLLLDTLRSLTGISGIDLTAFLTVIGLYIGIVCVVFGLLWQLPQPSVYNNYPNGKD